MLIQVVAWLVLVLAVEAAGRVAWTPAPTRTGRFLSPDPLGHAASPSLYDFAHGDPVNGFDPDGRFGKSWNRTAAFDSVAGLAPSLDLDAGLTGTESGALDVEAYVYWLQQRIAFDANLRAYALEQSVAWMDPYLVRAMGGLRAGGGALMMLGGFAVATGTSATGFGIAGGLAVAGKGADEFTTGITHVWTGEVLPSTTEMWLRSAGMTPGQAAFADAALTLGGSLGSARILAGRAATAENAGARMAPRGGMCFAAGTVVATPDGDVKIEDIEVGDTVWAYDFAAGKSVARRVTELKRNFTHYWVDVQVDRETIQATRGHPFWVESEMQWIEAADLKPGMSVRLLVGTTRVVSGVNVREVEAPETTYNFEVEVDHNYFVGQNHVLVHNPYPTGPAYPPATAVGETFQFNFDTSPGYEASRAAGVARARAAGLIQPGEIGHHINSVQTHPHLAAEPSNIAPEASRASHLKTHGGNWRNPTSGPLRPGC